MGRLVAAIGAVGLTVAWAPAEVAADDPPPSLSGEILNDFSTWELGEVDCAPDSSGTIELHASGAATGPYPGTFSEHVTVEFGPQDRPGDPGLPATGEIVRWTSDFTIVSGDTTITGTTSDERVPDSSTPRALCFHDGAEPWGTQLVILDIVEAVAVVDYTAEISTPQGRFAASGRSNPRLSFRHYRIDYDADGILDDEVTTSGYGHVFLPDGTIEPVGPGPAASLTLSPTTATVPVGGQRTLTAAAVDARGQAVGPTAILFSVEGSTQVTGTCLTHEGGCTWSYQGPELAGADSVTACADLDADQVCDPGEPTAEASSAWVLPAGTTGLVTGGGQVLDTSDPAYRVSFGFNARNRSGDPSGNCSIVDQSPLRNVLVKCETVTSLVVDGSRATFFGGGTQSGQPITYRIDVEDIGEPGRGKDTFRIRTSQGYTASGTLTAGNVQVHG